jgi:hypothetical protein
MNGKKTPTKSFKATLSSGDIPEGFTEELAAIMRLFIGTDWASGEADKSARKK